MHDILILLLAAVVLVPLFEKLKGGPILGYLIAGALVGPKGLGIVGDITDIKTVAEFGVIFLLFTIGLELTLERLKVLSLRVYVLGMLQVALTCFVMAIVASDLGVPFWSGIIIGGAFALSSTAIVLPVLGQMGMLNSRFGRIALAVLLLQDLAVGPFLILVKTLGGENGSLWQELPLAGIKMLVAVAIILVIGRIFLRPLFRIVANSQSPEIFAGLALLTALGTAFAAEHAGLSMAFGALLGGLILAETEFQHQVEVDIAPFRGILLGLFFMTVGMNLDFFMAWENLGEIIVLLLGIMLLKTLIVTVLSAFLGMGWQRGVSLGALLSQGGEFAFVLLAMASDYQLLPLELAQKLILVAAISMAITPLMAIHGQWFFERNRGYRLKAELKKFISQASRYPYDVLIIGYGSTGRQVASRLKEECVDYLVIDRDARRVYEAKARGEPIYYGDATSAKMLEAARVKDAKVAIIAIERLEEAIKAVNSLARHFPHLKIHVRGPGRHAASELRRAGATNVVAENFETGKLLAASALRSLPKYCEVP